MSKLRRIRFARSFLFAIACYAVFLGEPVAGCTCGLPEPPCAATGEAEAVFVGTVTGTDPFWLNRVLFSALLREDAGPKRFHFRVEEAFWGVDGKEVVVGSDGFFAGCGMFFSYGEKYLVYAYGRNSAGLLRTSSCSRTAPIRFATGDLDYLRKLRDGRAVTEVFGLVTRDERERFYPPGEPRTAPIAGVTIHLESATRSWKAISTEDGTYRFSDLPRGRFEIRADPGSLRYVSRSRKFALARGACAVVDFVGYPRGQILVKLVGVDGRPIPSYLIELEAQAPTPRPPETLSDTDGAGRALFQGLASGVYRVTPRPALASKARDGAAYPPNVTLDLENGRELEEITITLPAR
jgi:hypothetical protein